MPIYAAISMTLLFASFSYTIISEVQKYGFDSLRFINLHIIFQTLPT